MDQLERIVAAYQDAEGWLLRLIAQAVASGADNTAGIYRERLDALQVILRQAEQYLAQVEAGLLSEVGGALAAGFDEGVAQALASVPGAPVVPTGAVQALALETTTALVSQRGMILRAVEDGYRQVVRQVTTRAVTSGMAIDVSMQQALDQFAARGITSFVDSAGRRYGIDTYTRAALRTAQNRATNEGRVQAFRANDITLIQTNSHPAPAPQCAPYENRILSLDGQAGPRTVWDRVNDTEITVDVFATREEALDNGWRHVNCRHVETAFIPGTEVPEHEESDPKDYEAMQRQRAMERHVRYWRKRQAVALTPVAEAKAKAKVRAWQKEIKRHVDQHDFLSRQYSRERLFVGNPANAS